MKEESNNLLSPSQQLKLAENEKRLQEAEKLAKMGSWELDLVSDTLHWSDEIYRIFETTPQSFGATYEAFLGFIHPDDVDLINNAYTSSIKNKKPYGPITHRLLLPNGTIKFVEERGNTHYNEKEEPIRSQGIVQDITERVLGEHTKALLKEKEVLLKEIYHRVKNNLQLISSFISIQSSQIEDLATREIFNTCKDRINSIALIHDHLCRIDNLGIIKVDEYIIDLVGHLEHALGENSNITFVTNITKGNIPIDQAVPCGLILNEIISNSVKHAFLGSQGTITISIGKNLDIWKMEVFDDGKGINSISDLTETDSLGIEIIQSLVEQIDGDLVIEGSPSKGVHYQIVFK